MTSERKLNEVALETLRNLAARTATAAGGFVARHRPKEVEEKDAGGSYAASVVTEIDREAERRIIEALRPSIEEFGFGLLAEESTDSGSRHACEHFWAIDPIDGTLPFIEDREGYAVSISLVSRQGVSVIGAVYNPRSGELVHAARDRGVVRSGSPLAPMGDDNALHLYLDRSYVEHNDWLERKAQLASVAKDFGLTGCQFHVGFGAVLNATSVSHHTSAVYLRRPKPVPGGVSIWDFAATACIVREAGGVVSDAFGEPLDLNRKGSSYLGHRGVLYASSFDLVRRIRACVPLTA